MNLRNTFNLGVKELRGLWRDPVMLVLIVYSFSLSIWTSANVSPEALTNAAISIVDEDQSHLSARITSAFYPPYFVEPQMTTTAEMDRRMDQGLDTFALNIPPDFARDVLAGKNPAIQLNIDATRMSQAFTGGGYIQQIVSSEVSEYVAGYRAETALPVTVPAIGRVRELTATITGAVAEGDAAAGERAAAADELWALRAEHADAPALSEDEVRGVLAAMSGQLAAIVAAESAAVQCLGAVVAE